MAFPFGAVIGAGASLIGGLLGRRSTKKANDQNIAMQREFAQNSIRWRVEDAKRAGIHPAFALGAPTMSFAPSSVGDSSMPAALAAMGQDISRAVDVTRTAPERFDAKVQALTLQRMGLENDLLASQIRKINQVGAGPAMAGGAMLIDGQGDLAVVETPPTHTPFLINTKGDKLITGASSDAQTYENRYGDIVQEVAGLGNLVNDFVVLPARRYFDNQRVQRRINNSYWK